MASTLLRSQRFLHRTIGKATREHVRTQSSNIGRDFSNSTRFNWNFQPGKQKLLAIGNSQRQISRSISLSSPFKGITPRVRFFVVGFGGTILYMMSDSLYDKYRRSGFSVRGLLSSGSQQEQSPMFDVTEEGSTLSSKYVSLLSKLETPELKASRIVPGTIKLPNMKLTLLQYQTCPFCCKVRAFLDYYGLPYEVIEVNPVMRQQLKFSTNYKKVPILLITKQNENEPSAQKEAMPADDSTLQINDSTLIISALTSYLLSLRPTSRHHSESLTTLVRWYLSNKVFLNEEEEQITGSDAVFTANKSSDEIVNRYFLMIGDVDPVKFDRMDPPLAEERRWRRWVDEQFVHVLSPNIYRTYDEALKSFNYFSDVGEWEKNFANWERKMVINVGALAMYYVSKRLKKKYNLKDDVRLSLYDSCNYWLKGIGPNRRFMGGDLPNLADLAVYGSLSSIEGCEAFTDLMNKTKMSRWYFDMKTMVDQHEGSQKIKLSF